VPLQTALLADEQPTSAEVVRRRDDAPNEAEERVRLRVGGLGGAAQRAVRDEQEQDTERVDDNADPVDHRHPTGDGDAAQKKRPGDPDDDQSAAELVRHDEVRQQGARETRCGHAAGPGVRHFARSPRALRSDSTWSPHVSQCSLENRGDVRDGPGADRGEDICVSLVAWFR
jgi:hypothetical protein